MALQWPLLGELHIAPSEKEGIFSGRGVTSSSRSHCKVIPLELLVQHWLSLALGMLASAGETALRRG